MNSEQVLYGTSRTRKLGLAAFAASLAAVGACSGVYVLLDPQGFFGSSFFWARVILGAAPLMCAGFFALAAVFGVVQSRQAPSSLCFAHDKLVVTVNGHSLQVMWTDSDAAEVINYAGKEWVFIRRKSIDAPRSHAFRVVVPNWIGPGDVLLHENYGMRPTELAHLINQWREASLGEASRLH